MRKVGFLILWLCSFLSAAGSSNPAVFSTAKPWAYWWWPGSAVTEKGITYNLESFAKAGFGGLHIIPIYGAKGYEEQFQSFLGPGWQAKFSFVLKEAQRLHLGIDMTLGTGWPLGGPQIKSENAAKSYKIEEVQIPKGSTYTRPKDCKAASIYVNDVFVNHLTASFHADSADTKVVLFRQVLTNQQVKRAAPGGEGLVMDHFNKKAFEVYREAFVPLLSKAHPPLRALYNDSYEVYGANFTPDFFDKFQALNGYDLRIYLNVLAKTKATSVNENHIWADYHRTIAALLLSEFTEPFAQWITRMGFISRDQAHGSPGNLLDLYAAVDIPETEFFGSKPFKIPGYRVDPDYDTLRFGIPDVRNLKLASSAANLLGKKRVSAETATWLGNHFQVSLSQVKPVVDQVFIGGVNHIFYHGATYSPPEIAWPGWLFYASTNFNPQSHFWEALPELNRYIETCQTMLQALPTDADVLMYFPMDDIWHERNGYGKLHPLDLHANSRDWMVNTSFGHWSSLMQDKGFQLDYISDLLLKKLKISPRKTFITSAGGEYKLLLIPAPHFMGLETIELLASWVKQGLPVYFLEHAPLLRNTFLFSGDQQARWDAAWQILHTRWVADPVNILARHRVAQEKIAEQGISFIRKKSGSGAQYFLANLSNQFTEGMVQLAKMGTAVSIEDPLVGSKIETKLTKDKQFFLHLAPGQSVIVRSLATGKSLPAPLLTKVLISPKQISLQFPAGGPSAQKMDSLRFWTVDSTSHDYWGKGTYAFDFDASPDQIGQKLVMHLDQVRDWVRVRLNGKDLGIIWSLPYQIQIPAGLLQARNHVEFEVTNVSANRIRKLDRDHVTWKNFYEINFVDIQYRPFDASKWSVTESGLQGPIYLSNR